MTQETGEDSRGQDEESEAQAPQRCGGCLATFVPPSQSRPVSTGKAAKAGWRWAEFSWKSS